MPTYEYECLSCGRQFEQFQQMSDKLLQKCPQCGGKVRRLIGTGSGIIFKALDSMQRTTGLHPRFKAPGLGPRAIENAHAAG